VTTVSRLRTAAVLVVLALWPAAFATADNDNAVDAKAPSAQTQAATEIGDRTATLNGQVRDNRSTTSFRFEYGTTTGYGQSTTASKLSDADVVRTVSAKIDGLVPDTVYHFRVRASNHKGEAVGEDRSFRTTTPPSAATDPGTAAGTSPPGSAIPLSSAAPKPVLGGSVVVAPLKGTIKIKLPAQRAMPRSRPATPSRSAPSSTRAAARSF
jgi:hypothetical protein